MKSHQYVSSEGKIIKVTYTAGAGIGFNPRSTEDVIPAAIIDAIELDLKNPPEIAKSAPTIMLTSTAGAGIGFNPRSTEDVIPAAIIDAIELNLKFPPETS